MEKLKQKLKSLGNLIRRNARKKDHSEHLWQSINLLRNEIVDDVLQGSAKGRIPVKKLKHKAELIKKYSRRLKLLQT